MESVWWLTLCLVWQVIYQANGLKMQITNISSSPKVPSTDTTDLPISFTDSLKTGQENVEKLKSPFVTIGDTETNGLQQIAVTNTLNNINNQQLQSLNSISNQEPGIHETQKNYDAEVLSSPDVINTEINSFTNVFQQMNVPRTFNNMDLNSLVRTNGIANQEKIIHSEISCVDKDRDFNTDILNDLPSMLNSEPRFHPLTTSSSMRDDIFKHLHDTEFGTHTKFEYDVNNLIRSKNNIDCFLPQINQENVENIVNENNSNEANNFNNLHNVQSLPCTYQSNQIVDSNKLVNSNTINPWAEDNIQRYFNSIQSLKKYQSHCNFNNLYDTKLAIEKENENDANNMIRSKNSIDYFLSQTNNENVENIVEENIPNEANHFNNLYNVKSLPYIYLPNQIDDSDKLDNSNINNPRAKDIIQQYLNSIQSLKNYQSHSNFNNLYDTKLAIEKENENDVNMIRNKNGVDNFLPQINNENVENIVDENNPNDANHFNNLYNVQSLPYIYLPNQIDDSDKLVNSNTNNPRAMDIIQQYLNNIQSLKNYQSHSNFNNLYDTKLATEKENENDVNDMIRSKNSIDYSLSQINYENVENIVEENNPNEADHCNNLYNVQSLPYIYLPNQIDDSDKLVNSNINNPWAKDNIQQYLNSIRSLQKCQSHSNFNNLYDTKLATDKENEIDVNDMIRSKNSIDYFLSQTNYRNVENIVDKNNSNEDNHFNNLYNIQSLPYIYLPNQIDDSNKLVNSNINNPWAKDNIQQYLNSIQSLKNYQSQALRKPINEYTNNIDPRVQNYNVFNTHISQKYEQNTATNEMTINENNLEDLLELEKYIFTNNLEGQVSDSDLVFNMNSVDTKPPTNNNNLNNLYNLLYSQNANYRNRVSSVPSYVNQSNNVVNPVINVFDPNSNFDVSLQPSVVNFNSSVLNWNSAQRNFQANTVLLNNISPNDAVPISNVVASHINEMPISDRTVDLNHRNNYFSLINEFRDIGPPPSLLIEPVNIETLSESINQNIELLYDPTFDFLESISTSCTDKRSTPAFPIRSYDTSFSSLGTLNTPNYILSQGRITPPVLKIPNPFQFSRSGIGLNSISSPYAGNAGTKLSVDTIPIKPELLASIKPLSTGFGVENLLNLRSGSCSNNNKSVAPETDVLVSDNILINKNSFNNVLQAQPLNCELYLDPVITVPTLNQMDIISKNKELSQNFNFVNPFITNSQNAGQPRCATFDADDFNKNVNLLQPNVGIYPLTYAPDIPSLVIDPRSYQSVNGYYPSLFPQIPTINNVPIINSFPQYKPKLNLDLSPLNSLPLNVDPVYQYIASSNEPINELCSCSVSFEEPPCVQTSYDQAFNQLPDPNHFPITNIFTPEHNIDPQYSYSPFRPSEINSSPLHYKSAAPEVIEVPYNLYNDAFSIINSQNAQNLVGNLPNYNGSPVSFTSFDPISPQTGFMNPVSNLPNVYPSSNIMIPQVQPTVSYTNLVSNNLLSSQVDKLLSPSGVANSINDAASIVAKSAISSLISKKLSSQAQNTPSVCIPSVNPYLPSSSDSFSTTALDSPFSFDQFYSHPSKTLQTNPQLYNGFDVPDILSHLNFNEIPNIVPDYPDVTDFDFDFETANQKTPLKSSLTVNILPVIEEFGFEFKSPTSNPLIGYNDFPNICPTYLPTPNINAVADYTPQVIDVPAITSSIKGKDCKELGRLLELLVMSELLNNNEYDLDALEAILTLLCVS